MDNKEYNNLLVKYHLLDSSSVRFIELLAQSYNLDDNVLMIVSTIFSYQHLGHCYAPLNNLVNDYTEKLNSQYQLESEENNNLDIKEDFNNLRDTVSKFDNYINLFKNSNDLIGEECIFIIDDNNYVFISKYYYSSIGIKDSFNRLFKPNNKSNTHINLDFINGTLALEQQQAIEQGLTNNLLITGGPGTGKTTTILFLLLYLLKDSNNLEDVRIYLTAPSGKAATRMDESIKNNLNSRVKSDFKDSHNELIKKIESLKGQTIDKLLGYTLKGYKYNTNNQITPLHSNYFIIDEASMIDILKFNSLLNAIPNNSRVFILGDKDQLPSVENGAVFNDLISHSDKDFLVSFTKSYRFSEDTDVYKFSKYINCDSNTYTFDFKNINDFNIESNAKCSVKLYDDTNASKEDINRVIKKWYDKFFKSINNIVISIDELKNKETNKLDKLYNCLEESKILCTNNNGTRGINTINKYIKEELCKIKKKNYYHGQILMIIKNNKELDLYNGDNGICIELDNRLYFMTKKSYDNIMEGYNETRIFKIAEFVFYPLDLIKDEDIVMSYAITIHKSQGSEYNNVLILLPNNESNPLLTRQIVYTAITRTRNGSCYIISNEKILNHARDHKEERLTKVLD